MDGTAVAERVELSEEILEERLPCRVREGFVACPDEATWIITKTCCGATTFMCENHFHAVMHDQIAQMGCTRCEFISRPASSQVDTFRRV
ncbi:hypothetical protein HOT82_gp089 [Gordonia phage Ronaldo]|uniref:Uncharacterized protein n=4 Tax=Ronaldovirus TaxID=2733205 RepID=A0A6B9LGK0_9CAUD|nr:hypothetical protein HOT81_gp085 [Gordonia phage Fryberger]YP_009807785.1 hypothetical protein HOT82_gp089 [Gordonia phage Ronaldo]QDH48426.1 hypothetical protein SEA_ZIKO_88 [Gordonia phage Ziko]QHB38205.1 hypothetical protein SEA_VOLT_89 [Gordonia phage Volt]QTF81875.1 hypothetical protein SEA_GUEY18_90 [Gordonia phage Guey18]AXN53502.1 hypothetical protein SEA_FRYBERGER_85 [Gordonia phage Fryberger]AXN53651.1 hypothetical protein SEA_RONALDO_89 [Gordonia phage Ronaldo]